MRHNFLNKFSSKLFPTVSSFLLVLQIEPSDLVSTSGGSYCQLIHNWFHNAFVLNLLKTLERVTLSGGRGDKWIFCHKLSPVLCFSTFQKNWRIRTRWGWWHWHSFAKKQSFVWSNFSSWSKKFRVVSSDEMATWEHGVAHAVEQQEKMATFITSETAFRQIVSELASCIDTSDLDFGVQDWFHEQTV